MHKSVLVLVLIFGALLSGAQHPIRFSIENATMTASDSVLPFWLSANRQGKIEHQNAFLNLTDLFIGQNIYLSDSSLLVLWGGNLVAGLGQNNYSQVNRAYGGVSFKGWKLMAGMFYDPVKYAGLSTTNGNLARSSNARPYPKLRFSTAGYKPVPGLKKWLGFKAEYSEGLLNDDRIVQRARLHHKSLYLKVIPATDWKITAGMEHYVFWGGTSPDERFGAMPKDLKSYLKYVLGSSGNTSFPQMDQNNVAGNQLGTYQLEVAKSFQFSEVAFYISHPFEDLSGINLRNWPDNLLGIHFRFKGEQKPISDVVYEFTRTKHQSILNNGNMEPDNYFNHSIYKSGFTYHRQILGSPLFFPIEISDGKSYGIVSNRYVAHHVAATGFLGKSVKWKGMLTGSRHEGKMRNPYPTRQITISGFAEAEYSSPDFPVALGLSVAADAGSKNYRNAGVCFQITKSW